MNEVLLFVGAFGGVAACITAIAVMLKVGVEKTDVKIGTADKVMIGQDRFIDQLEEALASRDERINALEARIEGVSERATTLHEEVVHLRNENRLLREKNDRLRQRVDELEQANGTPPGPYG